MLQKVKGVVVSVAGISAMSLGSGAMAALPVEVATAFTTIGSDATEAIGYGWTLFLTVAGGLVLIGIAKKVLGKAT